MLCEKCTDSLKKVGSFGEKFINLGTNETIADYYEEDGVAQLASKEPYATLFTCEPITGEKRNKCNKCDLKSV